MWASRMDSVHAFRSDLLNLSVLLQWSPVLGPIFECPEVIDAVVAHLFQHLARQCRVATRGAVEDYCLVLGKALVVVRGFRIGPRFQHTARDVHATPPDIRRVRIDDANRTFKIRHEQRKTRRSSNSRMVALKPARANKPVAIARGRVAIRLCALANRRSHVIFGTFYLPAKM